MTERFHEPVLAREILDRVGPRPKVVDGTLGDGGHTALFREAGSVVLGIDRDPEAIRRARTRLGADRVEYVLGNAYDDETVARIAEFRPDLILLDLGVSSRQLDDDTLGFTFRPGVALDMRMERSGPTAAELLNESPVEDLTRWIADYGDERRARRLGAEIVRRRANRPFVVSDDLVNAIRAALGPSSGPPDFARIFQAIRIAVNGELEGLAEALPALRDALAPSGALAVISYHSGEDRLIKNAFRDWSAACVCPPAHPICTCRGAPLGRSLTRKPVEATDAEIQANGRARSAKLRIFEVNGSGPAR